LKLTEHVSARLLISKINNNNKTANIKKLQIARKKKPFGKEFRQSGVVYPTC